ncbi:MAG: hypothetical protein J0J01_24660 [Reyranella sp.]|uniref:hypothetical protein n=1 Tax=Reyranella sp. TaxID=1929291 RepID=UPI001AD5D079|nr:hypothetical protein [Reyranella sp.]MBN9090115.1 hypothetical protein [Reyranella sp.]
MKLPALSILSAMLLSNGAEACWVERVKRTATGIDVYFQDGRTVRVIRDNRQTGIFQTYSARTTTVYQVDGVKLVEAVPARLGDRLISSNSPHDSCTLTVAIRDGRIGLEASAFTQSPAPQIGNAAPATAQYFIPAN